MSDGIRWVSESREFIKNVSLSQTVDSCIKEALEKRKRCTTCFNQGFRVCVCQYRQ